MLGEILMPSAHRRGWSLCHARGLLLVLSCCAWIAAAPRIHALGTGKPLWEYGQRTWQTDSGLPQNTVHAIVQTRDGYLWIGTEAGLVRYDGVDFRVFDTGNTPALHSDFISALTVDASGSLWISTPGGLLRERAGAFTAYDKVEGLPSAIVLRTYVTHDGRLLALTSGGAAEFRGAHFVALPGTEQLALADGADMIAEDTRGRLWIAGPQSVLSPDGRNPIAIPEVGEIQSLAVTSTGDLWVGGADGITVFDHGKRTRLSVREGLPSDDVTSLLATSNGGVWIGASKGLAFFSHGTIKAEPALAGRRVQSLFLDRAGTLWVATADTVARITEGAVEFTTRRPLLAGVLSMFEDREGSMWFGTEAAGLHVLREQPFSTITVDDGLSSGLVRAILEDHSGNLWIGTGGGLDRMTAGKVSVFEGTLPSNEILALAESGGALWVGTPEGLVRIRDGRCSVFTTADGLADDFVRSLYADRDGSLWIGTRNGLSHLKNGAFHSYSSLDGLGSDLVGTILRGHAGDLWIGTFGGLSRLAGDRFINIKPHGSAASDAVTALLEDSDGTLWIGTNGDGLSRLRDGKLAVVPPGTALPATIFGMLEDANGNLWLSSRKGIDRVSVASLNSFVDKRSGPPPVSAYGSADGLGISEASGGGHPAAWRARDGGLWFAMLNGAAVVYPGSALRNSVPPLTSIEQIIVDDLPVHTEKNSAIVVPPGRGRLTIRYAGLSFVAPQKVHYRYKLAGFDKSWIDAGSRRTAFYTNVPPGSYRFYVLSANNDGVWSIAPAEVRFIVKPYFYQTVWFYALMAIALGGLAYLIYRWRVLTVQAQYQAVLAERGRIAREIHDTLAQGYVAVSVQLELAERLLQSSTEAAAKQLRQTKELVRDSLAEARSSIWNLRAQSDAETLPAQVAAMTRRQTVPDGATVRFTVHGTYRPLARRVETEIQRIAQEALANAVTHAQASMISVTLLYDVRLLELRVEDDGVGLGTRVDSPSPRGHFGLQGMRERAARIDSLLDIDSGAQSGTVVTLRVDLHRALEKDA